MRTEGATRRWLNFPQKVVEPNIHLIFQVQHTSSTGIVAPRGKVKKNQREAGFLYKLMVKDEQPALFNDQPGTVKDLSLLRRGRDVLWVTSDSWQVPGLILRLQPCQKHLLRSDRQAHLEIHPGNSPGTEGLRLPKSPALLPRQAAKASRQENVCVCVWA